MPSLLLAAAITLQLGSETFHIPETYVSKSHNNSLTFGLILPDLAPASSDPNEAATWGKGTGWHKLLHVLVQHYVPFISQQKIFEDALDDSERMKALQDADPRAFNREQIYSRDKFDIQPNGCKIYHGYSFGGDLMQTCGEGPSFFVVQCRTDPTKKIIYPSCNVMINYDDQIQLTYTYGYDYLPLAPEIHQKLFTLLDSWKATAH
jgi:hypothetical protein